MANFGTFEMVILLVVVLIIFGPKSLPKIGQALGKGIREFKDATRGLTSDVEDDQPRRSAIPQGTSVESVPSPAASDKPVNSVNQG
jgi:sec-independent protein translocase protein TatA